jgi:hypothetical protein
MVATYQSNTRTVDSIHDTITHNIHTNPKWRKAESGDSTGYQCTHHTEKVSTDRAFTPTALMEFAVTHGPTKFEHYANPMVHPVTGETISSYKKLMNDPAMAEVWQTAFGKDFEGMAQGDNKTGQKGTNATFVMTHDDPRSACGESIHIRKSRCQSQTPKRRPQLHTNHSWEKSD